MKLRDMRTREPVALPTLRRSRSTGVMYNILRAEADGAGSYHVICRAEGERSHELFRAHGFDLELA